MLFSSKPPPSYNDDFFADTRMSFGDHIEELRTHLIRAIAGLAIVLFGGGVLDMVGYSIGNDNIGLGRPMMTVIVEPVERMVLDFYARRSKKGWDRIDQLKAAPPPDEAEVRRIREKRTANGGSLDVLTASERDTLARAPVEITGYVPVEQFAGKFDGPPKNPAEKVIGVRIGLLPAEVHALSTEGELLLGQRKYVTTLSVQEPFVVYFKVLLLSSFVIASPWVFYQIWAFVAAGLYPHERGYVYRFLGPSITLFLVGVLVCQLYVLPGAVKALIGFNEWINLDPDIRLNEWLGFALILPLVFGVSFQTPLVMFFFNRIGTFSAADYLAKWRIAVMVLAFFSAIITPTPDVVTMSYLFVPMFGLYLIGIVVCYVFPPDHEKAWKAEDQQVAV